MLVKVFGFSGLEHVPKLEIVHRFIVWKARLVLLDEAKIQIESQKLQLCSLRKGSICEIVNRCSCTWNNISATGFLA